MGCMNKYLLFYIFKTCGFVGFCSVLSDLSFECFLLGEMLNAIRFAGKNQAFISCSRLQLIRLYHTTDRSYFPTATVFAANTKIVDNASCVHLPYRLHHVSVSVFSPEKTRMFNREQEVDFILKLLRNKMLQLSLITGPINSGKSILMQHVLKELSQDAKEPTILALNMRVALVIKCGNFH